MDQAHQGDLTVGASDVIKAGKIVLAADGKDSLPVWDAAAKAVTGNGSGNVIVNGTLDATGARGGEIDLLARNNLVLGGGSRTLASATGAGGPAISHRQQGPEISQINFFPDPNAGPVLFFSPGSSPDLLNVNRGLTGVDWRNVPLTKFAEILRNHACPGAVLKK